MIIRYVLGRPVAPKEPEILKSGAVSTNKLRDTSAAKYIEVCKREDQAPKPEYIEHLQQRDETAWTYKYDMYCDDMLMSAALYDAQHYQKAIATSSLLPPKNAFACDRCHWRTYCESDPMAQHIEDWMGVINGREASEIRIKYGRTSKTLKRDRRGFIVSPSELRSFATCNRRWAFEYRWRMKIKEEGLSALALVRGQIVHRCLEIITNQRGFRRWLNTDLKTEVSIMISEMLRVGEISQELFDEFSKPEVLEGMVDRSQEMFTLAMDDVNEIIECEDRRIIKMPGTKKWLQGIPDAVVKLDSGEIAVIEYKTTGKSNLPKLADSYRTNPAVHLYAALVRHGQTTF